MISKHFTFHLFLFFISTGNARAAELSQQQVEVLVQRRPDPVYGPELYEEWCREVRNAKGLNPVLFAMLKQEQGWERVRDVLNVLAQRTDLTKEELVELKAPVTKMLGEDPAYGIQTSAYVFGVIGVLTQYPGEQSERFILSILEKAPKSGPAVLNALAQIGTSRSLDPLRKYADSLRADNRAALPEIEGVIELIQKKEAKAGPPPRSE